MAQNITLQGATYSAVPAVDLPKQGGGTARFTDVTDTTAAASDVAAGKYFFTASGVLTLGTSSGGGGVGGVTQDENGYIVLDDDAPTSITVEPLSVTSNGTYTAPTGKAYSPVTVSVSGGTVVEPNDVNFFDYDGAIVASYSAADFASLASLPSNPSHTGLTAQGWNWTLSDAKTRVASVGFLDIGQMYTPTSGKTEIDISLPAGYLAPYIYFAVNGTAVVEWGDGNSNTVTGTSETANKFTQHIYAAAGDYTIKIAVTGTLVFTTSNYYGSVLSETGSTSRLGTYTAFIKAIRVGPNVKIGTNGFSRTSTIDYITLPSNLAGLGTYAFTYSAIRFLTIPTSVSSVPNYCFNYAYHLQYVAIGKDTSSSTSSGFGYCASLQRLYLTKIPESCARESTLLQQLVFDSSVTSIGNFAFYNCRNLGNVTLPSSLTTIGNSAFASCASMTEITIPATVTSLGNSVFSNAYSLRDIHVKPTTPPTLGTSTFSLVAGNKIYVPTGHLSDYQTASGWSTYASYMEEE